MGTNGIDPRLALMEREKCKLFPNKKIYKSSEEAWDAAHERSKEAHMKIVPYVCDGCGWFHLTSSKTVNDKVIPAEVGITTTTLKRKTPVSNTAIPIRKDMSDNGLTIPGNFEAGVKMLTAFLKDKTSATKEELLEALPGVSKNSLTRYMKRVGWYNTRGRNPLWKPESEKKATATITPITSKKKVIVPSDNDILESVKRHPAGKQMTSFPEAVKQHDERTAIEVLQSVGETPKFMDWRTMDPSKFKEMKVSELLETLATFGMEVRIQAAFKE